MVARREDSNCCIQCGTKFTLKEKEREKRLRCIVCNNSNVDRRIQQVVDSVEVENFIQSTEKEEGNDT